MFHFILYFFISDIIAEVIWEWFGIEKNNFIRILILATIGLIICIFLIIPINQLNQKIKLNIKFYLANI